MHVDSTEATNLTNDPDYDFWSSWSPDGTRIVFGSDRDGAVDLYTMTPAGDSVEVLLRSDGWDDVPVWR